MVKHSTGVNINTCPYMYLFFKKKSHFVSWDWFSILQFIVCGLTISNTNCMSSIDLPQPYRRYV